jgi:hypothetical protein
MFPISAIRSEASARFLASRVRFASRLCRQMTNGKTDTAPRAMPVNSHGKENIV